MAVDAAITVFRQEVVAQFEVSRSWLAGTTTKESMMRGYSAVFLVSDAARYVTGHELLVDGGLTINGSVGHARS